MPRTHLWNPWPSRCWPANAAEEQAFLDALAARAAPGRRRGRTSVHAEIATGAGRVRVTATAVAAPTPGGRPWTRSDLTCVLTALRGGASVGEIFEVAPGLDAASMVRAYRDLEALRGASEDAWAALCAERSVDALENHGLAAAKLLPVPVARLWNAAYRSRSRLGPAVDRQASLVEEARAAADHLIGRLTALGPARTGRAPEEAVVLGRQLFNPVGSSLFAHSHFLARRVGELSSVRVADLLGERRDDTEVA